MTARALAFNPTGMEAVESFPEELFFWLEPHYNFYQPQHADYQYHWTDGSGSYQHSNDPFFNPNIGVGSTAGWTLMPKKS